MSAPSREDAINELAERLHFLLNKYDPGNEDIPWEEMTDHQREIFRATVRGLLTRRDLISVVFA